MSSPLYPFSGSAEHPFIAQELSETPTSTQDKNLIVGNKSSIFPAEQYFVW